MNISVTDITADQAAILTSQCRIEYGGNGICGDNGPLYVIAIMWCNKTGEHISEKGASVLEAVINVHNKISKMVG